MPYDSFKPKLTPPSKPWQEEARRRFPSYRYLSMEGPIALLSCSHQQCITLHRDMIAAERQKERLDAKTCSSGCLGDHQLVDLSKP